MRVDQVMTTDPLTAAPDELAARAAQRMFERGISGMPVVARSQDVVGVISEADFLKAGGLRPGQYDSWLSGLLAMGADEAAAMAAAREERVAQVMSVDVRWVSPEDHVARAAAMMESCRIKRLVVLDKRRLVGVISRSDLIRVVAIRLFERELTY